MKMNLIRVSLGFSRLADLLMLQFAKTLLTKLFGNAGFPAPPVTEAVYAADVLAFEEAKTAQRSKGTQGTVEKDARRATLVERTRELASYVQMVAGNNLELLVSSGFEPVLPAGRTTEPLSAPQIVRLKPGQSGELIATVAAARNVRSYEVEYAEVPMSGGDPAWRSAGVMTNGRRLVVAGLTRAVTYLVRVRAVGGASGYSDWSQPATEMCL
jgi:hypothetical protein